MDERKLHQLLEKGYLTVMELHAAQKALLYEMRYEIFAFQARPTKRGFPLLQEYWDTHDKPPVWRIVEN